MPVEAHMVHCSKIKKKPNLIDHASDRDGSRRSLQACYIIERFNPSTARDFAKIIWDNNVNKNWWNWHLPIFWEDKELVDYCKKEYEEYRSSKHYSPSSGFDFQKWHLERCVSSPDEIDLPADTWKLSPNIQRNYPTTITWGQRFPNSSIHFGDENEPFEGWHDFKDGVEKELISMYQASKFKV